MALDLEGARLEAMMWRPIGELRWRRPRGCDDNDLLLELLWERVSGEREWRAVPVMMED